MTPRLYLSVPLRPGTKVELDKDQSHYVVRVLRLRPGDPLQLFDGDGGRHAAVLAQADARRTVLEVGDAEPGVPESPLRVTLAQCISAGEKMDWTVEKAVELGVGAIAPLQAARSVVRLDADRARRRAEHWQRLLVAACMQCGRDRLPLLHPVESLEAWLSRPRADAHRIVLAPGAPSSIGDLPFPDLEAGGLQLLVGPEGGLAPEELERALAAGFTPVSMGPRVLRTETAGLAALAVLQARFGDLRARG